MSTGKSDGDYVKLNLCRDHTSSMPGFYEFMMSLFDHGKPEEFLLFVQNFQITLAATETLETKAKLHYHCTLVRGEALRQLDLVYDDKNNTKTLLDVYDLLMGLSWYFTP